MITKNLIEKYKNKKSQAALEFLTTYAWAFIVIAIVIAAIAYFGILNPASLFPDRCTISPEIGCIEAKLGKTDIGTGVLRLKLKNNFREHIIITSWNTSSESATPFTCTQAPTTGIWPSGETRDIEFTGCNNNEAGLVLGQKSKVNMKVNFYPSTATSVYARLVEGEVFATVTTLESVLTLVNCTDGLDNDKNGCIDYAGGDTGCTSPADTSENNGACPNAGNPNVSLNCFVSVYCPDTLVFKISDFKDAHAETSSMTNYIYNVCCRTGNDTLSNSCASPDVIPLHLSNVTDAHAEKNTQSNYNTNVCLNAPTKTVTCGYTTDTCANAGFETCLATISGDTDAHVGDCVTQPFANKVCCKIG